MAEIKNFPNNADEFIYAQDVMKWHRPRTQGVYGAEGELSVRPLETPAMAVQITDGFAWLKDEKGNGCVCWLDSFEETGELLTLAIDASSATQSRIDRVVISWTPAGYVNKPEIIILKGTPSSSPVAPAITNNEVTRQISIAKINIPVGVSSITADLITDERLDKSVCGLVTEDIDVDTSVVQSKFDALLLIYKTAIENVVEQVIPPHAFTHAIDGSDPLTPEDIGAVPNVEFVSQNGEVDLTLENNTEYEFLDVTSFKIEVSTIKARGFIVFANTFSTPVITARAKLGDDITEAKPKETWEFDTENGLVIFKNWGVLE